MQSSSANMGTQGTGRKRAPLKDRFSAEDEALSSIAREVSSSIRYNHFEEMNLGYCLCNAESMQIRFYFIFLSSSNVLVCPRRDNRGFKCKFHWWLT